MDRLEQVGMALVGEEEEPKLRLFSSKLRTGITMLSRMNWQQGPMWNSSHSTRYREPIMP
jgi:hypothetical protein